MFNGEHVNDPIEEDDHTDNVVEDDGSHTLIHDSFNVRMDDDDDDDHENINEFDDAHDIPLLEKEYKPLYEDATKRRGDGKCYCPCNQCRGFKRRRILITTTRKHCREHGHTEGEHEHCSIIMFCIFFALVNVCIILIFLILTYIY